MDYQWNFSAFEVKPQDNNLKNVVVTVYYELAVQDQGYSKVVNGQAILSAPEPSNYVEFNNLTSNQVQQWVEVALGENQLQQIKTKLADEIKQLQVPSVVTVPAPWLLKSTI
jgi:hypothetical protein